MQPVAVKNSLGIDSVQLAFGNRNILSDIYLQCVTGSITVLLGRNGSGKSCLMQLLFGSRKGDCCVRHNGKTITGAFRQPGLVNYLPQKQFLPGSLKLREALKDFRIDPAVFLSVFPEYSTRMEAPLSECSSGTIRIVELYILLMSPTAFTLLDEPFSMLSPVQAEKFIAIMQDAKFRKGIILSDHLYPLAAQVADFTYLLKDGRLRFIKSKEELQELGYLPAY